MLRFLLLVFALFTLAAAPAKHPAARTADWQQRVAITPEGAYRIGTPAAKVKLVEYLSYTCPHCAHFAAEAYPTLFGDLVRRGRVQVELRHAIRDPADLAATLLVRCQGGRRVLANSEAVFAAQTQWVQKGYDYLNALRAGKLPSVDTTEDSQPAVTEHIAEQSGLTAMFRARGLTPVAMHRCLTNKAEADRLAVMASKAWDHMRTAGPAPSGTPSFDLNGAFVPFTTWDDLAAKLRAAGA